MSRAAAVHRVAILALPAVVPLGLGIPAQIFGPRIDVDLGYRLTVRGAEPGQVSTPSGYSLIVQPVTGPG